MPVPTACTCGFPTLTCVGLHQQTWWTNGQSVVAFCIFFFKVEPVASQLLIFSLFISLSFSLYFPTFPVFFSYLSLPRFLSFCFSPLYIALLWQRPAQSCLPCVWVCVCGPGRCGRATCWCPAWITHVEFACVLERGGASVAKRVEGREGVRVWCVACNLGEGLGWSRRFSCGTQLTAHNHHHHHHHLNHQPGHPDLMSLRARCLLFVLLSSPCRFWRLLHGALYLPTGDTAQLAVS